MSRLSSRGARAAALLLPLVLAAEGCVLRGLKPSEREIVSHAIFVGNDGRPVEPHEGRKGTKLPGDRYDPATKTLVRDTAYQRYLQHIVAAIRADSARRGKAPKLLLRIHGGLNTLSGALKSTAAMRDSIMADTAAGYYPLFINWESGLVSSYGEHLLRIRRGRRQQHNVLRYLELPFYLTADVGEGIVRAPLTWSKQFALFRADGLKNHQGEMVLASPTMVAAAAGGGRTADSVESRSAATIGKRRASVAEPERALFRAYAQAVEGAGAAGAAASVAPPRAGVSAPSAPSPHPGAIAISRFEYRRTGAEMVLHHGLSLLFSYVPTRLFVMPPSRSLHTSFSESYHRSSRLRRPLTVAGWLPPKAIALVVIDGLGRPAWDNMRRRTKVMFRTDREFDEQRGQVDRYVPQTGAVATFLDALQQLADSGTDYRLTIVGHSMGAIVATEMLWRHDSLPIDNIVFMAPAATVREFELSVVPYLERHDSAQFYNLTLHPWSDRRERAELPRVRFPLVGPRRVPIHLVPYGSLLEWIDAYFANPETDVDRMLGKYDNFNRTAFIVPQSIRERVHVKAFGYRSGDGCGEYDLPYRHGDFNEPDVLYWRSGFWHPGTAGCEEVRHQTAPNASAHPGGER